MKVALRMPWWTLQGAFEDCAQAAGLGDKVTSIQRFIEPAVLSHSCQQPMRRIDLPAARGGSD